MRKMTDHEWSEVCFCSIFGYDDWRSRAAIDAMLERRSDADEVTALKAQVERLKAPVSDEEARENGHHNDWGVACWYRTEIDTLLAARAAEKGQSNGMD